MVCREINTKISDGSTNAILSYFNYASEGRALEAYGSHCVCLLICDSVVPIFFAAAKS